MEESQVTKKLKSVTVATHMAAARERHIQITLEDLTVFVRACVRAYVRQVRSCVR
jgi:hypothetical protein